MMRLARGVRSTMGINGELPPAIQRLIQKIAGDPQSRAFVQLADLYLQSDLLEEAISVLSEGLRRHPTYVSARMMRGKLHVQMKRIHEAKDDFEAVIHAHPEHIQAYRNLAYIYRTMGKLGDSVTMCNKILAIDPQDAAARDLLLCVQDEICTMDEFRALPAPCDVPPNVPMAPDPALDSESAAGDTVREESQGPVADLVFESSSPDVCPTEPVLSLAASKHACDPAHEALVALNLARLQTWLVSTQTRRMKR